MNNSQIKECCGNDCGCHESPEVEPTDAIGTIKLEYLQHKVKTAAKINSNGEHEVVPTRSLERGEMVWVVQPDNSFIKYKVI